MVQRNGVVQVLMQNADHARATLANGRKFPGTAHSLRDSIGRWEISFTLTVSILHMDPLPVWVIRDLFMSCHLLVVARSCQ